MPAKFLPSQEELLHIWSYDPDTGRLHWKVKPNPTVNIGDVAGTRCKSGRIKVIYQGVEYRAHRIIWKMIYGTEPPPEIDHQDVDPSNNGIQNLRPATRSQNATNTPVRSTNKLGVKGVCVWQGKYMAQIMLHRKRTYLGSYDTIEEASQAYQAASKKFHGEYGRT